MIEDHIRRRLREKEILLMTHIVMGYPDFATSLAIIEQMVEGGVDLMELQIPFSEPIADGPVILNANQLALERGVTVRECLDFAGEVTRRFDIPFLYMSYTNILYRQGLDAFIDGMETAGIQGAIVPDLPPEEGEDYITAMKRRRLAPIFIFSPHTTLERMQLLSSKGDGFIYCVARTGVTGQKTEFSELLTDYLARCRKNTDLPLAVGFGVKDRNDVQFLVGKADIAVIGSQTIRLVEEKGPEAVSGFIRELR